jgi:hypothetical protein
MVDVTSKDESSAIRLSYYNQHEGRCEWQMQVKD